MLQRTRARHHGSRTQPIGASSASSASSACSAATGRRTGRWPLLLASVLLLGACATGAPPRSVELSLPPAFDAGANPAGGDAQALGHWWTLYQDPQLTRLTERALAQGFSVREALARLDESRALRSVALSRFDLQGKLQASAEARDSQLIGSANSATSAATSAASAGFSTSAGLSLPVSWELDLFGRRGATERSALADLEWARFDVEAARAAIAAEVARGLFQTRALKVQRNEAAQTLRIQSELLAVVSERARRGLAPSTETDRVAADLAQAQAQHDDLNAALLTARRALLVVVGSGTDALGADDVQDQLGAAPRVPSAMPGELLARRPDVRKAATRVRQSAAHVRLAELDFFPSFTLTPGIGLSAQRGAVDATTSFWSIGAGLTLPLLDRPRLQAQLKAEGARAEQVVLAYERTVQNAFSEADQALTRLQADRQRVATLDAGEGRARTAYQAALKRYELGFANLQELLDSERAWRATRSALTAAKSDALLRSVQVFQALGGGWDTTASLAAASAATTRYATAAAPGTAATATGAQRN